VGASGDGKGGSLAVARRAVVIPKDARADKILPGSGEGLVGVYAVARKEKGDKEWHTERIRYKAIIDCAEVDTLKALGGDRAGATLLPFLRSAWSGEGIGRSNATPERNVSIDDHSYRCVLTVGAQPERAELIINDTAGTAQRFVWLPMSDPNPIRIEAPAPIEWAPPGAGPIHKFYSENQVLIKVCGAAREDMIDDRIKRLKREGDVLDGHAMMSRLKVAAALGLLESRFEVSEEDWKLAGYVMAKSDETRSGIQATLAARAASGYAQRGKYQAISKVSAEETEEEIRDAKVSQVSKTLLGKLESGEWVSKSDLRRSLRATLRGYFDAALSALILTGLVEQRETDNGRGQQGGEVRRAS
jgi:hypothetical protein